MKKAQLDLAIQRVEQVSSGTFESVQYRDNVRDHMLEMVDKNIHGEGVVTAPRERAEGRIVDIMEALRAIFDTSGSGKSTARKKVKSAPKKQAKKKTAARKKKSG